MSDYEVNLVNNNMQDFYVRFHGPAESKCHVSAMQGRPLMLHRQQRHSQMGFGIYMSSFQTNTLSSRPV